jgi:membrane peptidoglycan carboxypeptidase
VVGRILAADGTVLYDAASRPALLGPALDPGIAVQVRHALEQGICCGSGTEAGLGGDVAQFGQWGSTQGDLDAWFAGSTPDLTTVVWGGLPAQAWRSYTEQAGATGQEFPG